MPGCKKPPTPPLLTSSLHMSLWFPLLFTSYASSQTTYSLISASLPSPSSALEVYLNNTNSSYTAYVLDPSLYSIKLLISPCPVSNVYCCQGKGEAACQENLVVPGGSSLIVVWSSNNLVVTCDNEFAESTECGTFLELHRPGKFTALYIERVTEHYANGFQTQFLSTKSACAGGYEVWWVVRTREGRQLLYVKPFFLTYPSCTPEQIQAAADEI